MRKGTCGLTVRVLLSLGTGSRIIGKTLFVSFAALFLFACQAKTNGGQETKIPAYESFRDVPGVTDDEIKAIEALQAQIGSFVYGMHSSTEAFYNENGEIRGYSALLCDWLSRLFGIRFNPAIYEWDDLLAGFETGDIDFTGRFMATGERRKTYFMAEGIAERSIKTARLTGSAPLPDIAASRMPRYAFLTGATVFDLVVPFSEFPFETVFVNDINAAYGALKSGQADAFFDDNSTEAAFDIYSDVIVEDFFPLVHRPISLSAKKPALQPIISVVLKILQNGGKEYFTGLYALGHQEYMRHKLYIRLTDEEKAYLRSHSVIPFGAEYYNYPISFYNVNEKKWEGIAHDVLREVQTLTGLSFKQVNDQPTAFPALLKMLEDGDVFFVTEVLRSNERAGRFVWPETGLIKNSYALLSKSEYSNLGLKDVWNVKVGISRNTAYAELFKRWYPDHTKTTEYESTDDAFNALERGEVDLVMASDRWLLSLTNYQEITGYKANIVFDRTSESFFGFNRDEAALCSLVDKAMKLVDVKGISGQWVQKTYDYQAKLARAQRPWLIGASGLLFCVLILLFFLFWRKRHEGKRLEDLVRIRTAEALSASKAKSGFLATMSHEMRTPMNAILGIAEIQLQDNTLSSRTKEALDKIYNSGDLLLNIINDILDLSKIEAGKLELVPTEYKTASLINDIVTLNMMRIGGKPIEFTLSVDENIPSALYGDELRIKQILNNVLSNSFKYTKEGSVKLLVSVESISFSEEDASDKTAEEGVTLVFSVSDTGQGMTKEQVDKLFDEYSRFNMEANRTTEGTGLGMSITRNLIRMMNGKISVESELNKGSVFTIRLPQRIADSGVLGRELAKSLEKFEANSQKQLKRAQIVFEPMPYGSVLIVDDVESNLYVARGLMAPYKLSIETVMSGFDAIDKIKKGNVYDIVFMDHMMPKMDGIEATKNIRDLGYTQPVVALTANAVVGQSDVFLANGFDGFISKPIDIRQLNAALKKFVRDKQPPGVIEAALLSAEKTRQNQEEQTTGRAVNPQLAEIFVRDARKAIATLEAIHEKGASRDDEDIRLYTINVHAMKSALANIGESGLSAAAAKLEQAGREKNITVMAGETPAFLTELRAITGKLAPQREDDSDGGTMDETADEDRLFLREKLLTVQEACSIYDKKTAKNIITGLREKKWTKAVKEHLGDMAEHLLNGDFEDVSRIAGKIIELAEDTALDRLQSNRD